VSQSEVRLAKVFMATLGPSVPARDGSIIPHSGCYTLRGCWMLVLDEVTPGKTRESLTSTMHRSVTHHEEQWFRLPHHIRSARALSRISARSRMGRPGQSLTNRDNS